MLMGKPDVHSKYISIIMTVYFHCYHRALHTSANEGFAGTMLFYHPVINQPKYQQTDAQFRRACCEIGFDDRYYCSKYFQQRRVNDCELPHQYTPPAIGILYVA